MTDRKLKVARLKPETGNKKLFSAFTLIELPVVIAIISILAEDEARQD